MLWFNPLPASWGLWRTDLREPPGDAAVHLVQDDDDHQVDDDGGGGDGDADARAPRGRGADGQGSSCGDPVDDHSEHDGERQPDLRGRAAQSLTKDLPFKRFVWDLEITLKTGPLGHTPCPPNSALRFWWTVGKDPLLLLENHMKKNDTVMPQLQAKGFFFKGT